MLCKLMFWFYTDVTVLPLLSIALFILLDWHIPCYQDGVTYLYACPHIWM